MNIYFRQDMIVGDVPKMIVNRTRRNMDVYLLGLRDAFDEACRRYAKEGTELYKAWYTSDYRKFIPSAYIPKYLDFEKYPLYENYFD